MSPRQGRERTARTGALWLLAIGFVLSTALSLAPVSWLQQRLRFGCEFGDEGWVCGELSTLLLPIVASIVLSALALGGVALMVRAIWDRVRLRAERLGIVAALAVLPTLLLGGLLLVDAIAHDAAGVVFEASRVAMFVERGMHGMFATAAAGVLAATGLRMRARGRNRRVAFLYLLTAYVLLLLAAGMSSLGTLPTGVVATAAIGAGWWIAAAAWPARKEAARPPADPSVPRSAA